MQQQLGDPVGKLWRVRMRVREVTTPTGQGKVSYILLGLLEEMPSSEV